MGNVFGLIGHNLSRLRPGRPIPARTINADIAATERLRPYAGPGSGLNITQLPTGFAYRAVAAALPVGVYKTTTSITARSGATVGTGSAKPQQLSGNTLSDRSTATEDVKNILNKTVATGSYIVVVRALGVWWVVAVGDCGNLS